MKQLFSGKARYADLDGAYELYLKRCGTTPKERVLSRTEFNRVVKLYCKDVAQRLEKDGSVELPCGFGMIAAVQVNKKPTFDKTAKKYRTGCLVDWNETRRTGTITMSDRTDTFGFVFVPRWTKRNGNLRCVGIRANKELYRRMKRKYDEGTLGFSLPDAENFIV